MVGKIYGFICGKEFKILILIGGYMTKQEAIYWFEKAIDVYEIFPIENDVKLESHKIAIDALKLQKEIKKNLKWYLDTNEENGVVYIPKFIIEKILSKL